MCVSSPLLSDSLQLTQALQCSCKWKHQADTLSEVWLHKQLCLSQKRVDGGRVKREIEGKDTVAAVEPLSLTSRQIQENVGTINMPALVAYRSTSAQTQWEI